MDMKRLLNSSKFWNAIFASTFGIVGFYFTKSEFIVIGIFSLFGLKQFSDGAKSLINAKNGIAYNKNSDQYESIKNNINDLQETTPGLEVDKLKR